MVSRRFPPGISFTGRSPFETRHSPGLPPAPITRPEVSVVKGQAQLHGMPLPRQRQGTVRDSTNASILELAGSTDDLLRLILLRLQQFDDDAVLRGQLLTIPFVANVAPLQIRPAERRSYMILQNQHAANQIIMGFGQPPGPAGAVPISGLVIAPGFGFYEMLVAVSQDPVWVRSDAANTGGVLLVMN